MSSSLASQLQALKVQTTGATSQKKIVSLLHDAKVAAKIDVRTTYELAKEAMDELCSMDGALDSFQTTLLHPNKAQTQFNRALLTKEELDALDVEIGMFFDALSPYFLLPTTHHVLEFMIRKYEVHIWNVDQILAMIICYHESPMFARFITICDLAKYPKWAFLEPVKTNNVPLLRANLSKRCFADAGLVRFIYTTACRIGSRNSKIMALYALVAMDVIDKSRITETILRWILPNIIDGLKNRSFPEHQTASYMIATKLASKTTLAPTARHQLVLTIAKTAPVHAQLDALLCLISVVQSQPFESFPVEALKHILKYDDVPQLLHDAMEAYDTTKFMRLFLTSIVLLHTEAAESLFYDLIASLASTVAPFIDALVGIMLTEAHEHPLAVDMLKRMLLHISKRFAERFDAGLNAMLKNTTDSELKSFCVDFVAKSFTGSASALHIPLEQSGLSLLLSLDHPNAAIRLHALDVLAKMKDASLEEPGVLLRRLNDDSPEVIIQVASSKLSSLLLTSAKPLVVLDNVSIAVNARAADKSFKSAVLALLKFTTGAFLKTHPNDYNAIIFDMLMLFSPKSTVDAHNLALSWSEVLPLLKQISYPPFTTGLKKVNDDLVLEHFGKRLTAESLEIVEAWAAPSAYRQRSLPLAAIEVLNVARQGKTNNSADAASRLMTLVKKYWNIINAKPVGDAELVSRIVEVVCDTMSSDFTANDELYDEALALLLGSSVPYFTLTQPVMHASLAQEENWKYLFQSLCRLTHLEVGQAVLTRSILLLSVMVECTPSMVKLENIHDLILSLLTALSNTNAPVRKVAIQCLKQLSKLAISDKKARDTFTSYQKVLFAFLKVKEELVMDSNYLATFCGSLFSGEKDKAFLEMVLESALVPHASIPQTLLQRLLNVMRCLRNSDLRAVWTKAITWFTPLLSKKMTFLEASIGTEFLSHFLKSTASKATFNVILNTVTTPSLRVFHSYIAKNMSVEWFASLNDAQKAELIDALVVLLRVGEDTTPSEVASLLSRVELSASILTKQLTPTEDASYCSHVTCVLEVLMNILPNFETSVLASLQAPLHAVLKYFVQIKVDVSEYSLQMIFGALHLASTLLKGSSTSVEAHQAQELVQLTLQSVQKTISQQTRNAALLFVSSLVDLYPAAVLQSLVPILTFASQLQLDEYSFHVLQQIVEHAVPYVHTDASSITTQEFLNTFVQAFDSLPIARRISLFQILLSSLSQHDEHANAIGVALLLQYAPGSTSRQEFCHTILEVSKPEQQIRTLMSMLQIASHIHLALTHIDEEEAELEEDAVALKLPADANTAEVLERIVSFVPKHLERKTLHHQIIDDEDAEKSLEHSYLLLAQSILLFLRHVTKAKEQDKISAVWERLSTTTLQAMDNLQQLLTAPGFVAVIGELLQHEDGVIRRRALQLLNGRIEEQEATLTYEEELLFIDMLDDLSNVLEDPTALLSDKQMALLSVDVLCRFFAKKHSQPFLDVLPTVMACCKLTLDISGNGHVVGSAFVCLSNLCHSLGPAVFPFVPQFFPTLLSCIEASTKATGETGTQLTFQQCLMAALRTMTQKFPQFLVSYLPRMLRLLFLPKLLTIQHTQIKASTDATIQALATGIKLRNLLPALLELYPVCCQHGDVSLVSLFNMVTTVVQGMDRAAVKAHMASLMRLYLLAMDLRRLHPTVDEHVEDQLIAAILALVMKLSEKQLKPLFLKLVSWVDVTLPNTQGPSLARQVVFYRVVVQLSNRLKSIFVPYFAHILPQCATLLAGALEFDEESQDEFFERPSKKQKTEVSSRETQWQL
ncbi:hypothetical protein THRCLA_08609, partial [Thraustotheca clavata]